MPQPGAVVGEMGVLDHEPRSADATADSDTTGLVIRRAAFTRLLTERPGACAGRHPLLEQTLEGNDLST